jgi:hypothetical protein
MNKDAKRTRKKHPVPYKEFDRLMRAIREQTRDYPQEALEDIFLALDMIEKKYGVEDSDD